MIGIIVKDICKAEKIGEKVDNVQHMAIGNEELENTPLVSQQAKCPKCSKLVDVKTSE